MAEFSGKIVSVVYANSEHDLIKIRYEDNGLINVFVLDVDHPDYPALEAEGWDADKILNETIEAVKAESAAFNIEVNNAAKELVKEKLKELDETIELTNKAAQIKSVEDMYSFVLGEVDNEELFKFKLWALELDEVKAASKEKKSSLRKAKSILEGLSIIYSIK